MSTDHVVARIKVVTTVTMLLAMAWAQWSMGLKAVLLGCACALIGYAAQHLIVRVRIKGIVDSTPTRSVQRVDWDKELRA